MPVIPHMSAHHRLADRIAGRNLPLHFKAQTARLKQLRQRDWPLLSLTQRGRECLELLELSLLTRFGGPAFSLRSEGADRLVIVHHHDLSVSKDLHPLFRIRLVTQCSIGERTHRAIVVFYRRDKVVVPHPLPGPRLDTESCHTICFRAPAKRGEEIVDVACFSDIASAAFGAVYPVLL